MLEFSENSCQKIYIHEEEKNTFFKFLAHMSVNDKEGELKALANKSVRAKNASFWTDPHKQP